MEYDPDTKWIAKEYTVYIMCCPQSECGHNIFDRDTPGETVHYRCRHTVGKQLYCIKNVLGNINSQNTFK